MPNYNNYPMPYGYNYGPQTFGPQSTYANPQMISQIPQQPTYNYEQPQTSSSVVWVQGEAGANAYPVGRGQTVMLMDSDPNANMFYLKSADAYTGRPLPLEKYHYTRVYDNIQNERQSTSAKPEQTTYMNEEYVAKADFEALKDKLDKLQKTLDDLTK